MSTFWAVVIGVGVFAWYLVGLPLAMIWSLNALFGLGIPYVWQTWIAAGFLGGLISGHTRVDRK